MSKMTDRLVYKIRPSDEVGKGWLVIGPDGAEGVYNSVNDAQARANFLNDQSSEAESSAITAPRGNRSALRRFAVSVFSEVIFFGSAIAAGVAAAMALSGYLDFWR